MQVYSYDKNTPQRLFYKDAKLKKGMNVTFTVWNDSGEIVFENQTASQIPNAGVYYYDFVTPNEDTYLVALGTEGSDPQGVVLKIGSPTVEKAFYLHGELKENLSVPYEVFDINSNVLSSGEMVNIVSGFYSTNVTGLNKPWFFEANTKIDNNVIN